METARNILGSKVFKLTLILFCLFLIGVFLLVRDKVNEVRAGEEDNVGGWAWSYPNFGWFSSNCSNSGLCPDADGPPPYDYGINVEDDGTVTGYLWSENIGWVRFENPDSDLSPEGTPAKAEYNPTTGKMSGWAKVLALGNDGWLKLRGLTEPATPPPLPGGVFHACADCKDVEIPGDPPTTDYQCNICFTDKFPDPSSTGIGKICGSCINCTEGATETTCGTCGSCDKYGVSVDRLNGRIVGWAWNGNDDPGRTIGVGWINFSPTPGGLALASPWLETKYGEIYGKPLVESPSAFVELIGKTNATYCILSNGSIVNFISGEGCVRESFEPFDFPKAPTYANIFGKIDLPGILAGKYGTVQPITSDTGADIPDHLAGKVYVRNGDLTISGKTFLNAVGSMDGSGLIVVKGNLNITGNITYDPGLVSGLIKNLASVGWLVIDNGSGTGKINISPSVENIVGAFYAEGEVKTGTTGNKRTDKSLTVHGLMLAKKFTFERLWQSAERGSEQVIYDGRVLANTPPGMSDLIRALPVWREAAP